MDIAILAGLSALLVYRAFHFDFISDDAFISLRYARNLVEGFGLVFNSGERVEGFTSPLHVLMLAALKALGLDLLAAARGLSLFSAVGLLILVFQVVVTATEGRGRWFAYAAVAGLAVNPYLAIWSLSGLETTLFAVLLVAAAYPLIVGKEGSRAFLLVSFLAAALTLTRPEGAAVYALLCAWHLITGKGGLRRTTAEALPGLAMYGIMLSFLLLWRQTYYGDWLPNTFYVKSAMSADHIRRGLSYIAAFAKNIYVVPTLVLIGFGVATRRRREVVFVLLLLVGMIAVVIGEGGDGLPAYRFLVPCLAPFFILAALASWNLLERFSSLMGKAAMVIQALLPLLIAFSVIPRVDSQYRYYDSQRRLEIPRWSLVGEWLSANVPPDTVIATVPIGAVAYYSGLRTIDMLGLTDRHIARRKIANLGAGWAGHEKTDGAYVVGRRPEIILLGNISVTEFPVRDLAMFSPFRNANIWAREKDIVTNPTFQEHYRFASLAMGQGKYLNAFFRGDFLRRLQAPVDH